jgi:phage FluMu protein Com
VPGKLFAMRCTRCNLFDRETARLFGKKNDFCVCEAPSTLRCSCGWCGAAERVESGRCYLVVDCPKCKATLQGLTPQKRELIESETGRSAHDNLAIVSKVLRSHFSMLRGEIRSAVEDAGRRAIVVAMVRWNPALGTKFSTYAFSYVHGRMMHAVRDESVRQKRHTKVLKKLRESYVGAYEVDYTATIGDDDNDCD